MPLGTIVLGSSGDKASDCKVGFFVRPSPSDELWHCLCTILTIGKVKELLGPDEVHKFDKPKLRVDRFEMPHIRPVHFLSKVRKGSSIALSVFCALHLRWYQYEL